MATTRVDSNFPVHEFPGGGDPGYLVPMITDDVAPFYEALNDGRFVLQACETCDKLRWPLMPVCPYCFSDRYRWQDVPGGGTVYSWIRYHKSYLPEFESLIPYSVLCVQLDEGPRVFGRLASTDMIPQTGQRVRLVLEKWPSGQSMYAFALAD
jgi:uncharacterized protein